MNFQDRLQVLVSRGIPGVAVRPGIKDAFEKDWPNNLLTDLSKAHDHKYENCNTGAVAQAKEGGFWYFEVDDPGVLAQIKTDTGHDLVTESPTFMVKSREGRGHFYWQQSPLSIKMGNIGQSYGPWSARVNNQYVVGPGSHRNDTNTDYTIVRDVPIVSAPDWLCDWLIAQKTKHKGDDAPRNEYGRVSHGAIHPYMVTAAGKLRSLGMSVDLLESVLLELVHENCEPPIDEDKVRQVARSMGNYEPQPNASLPMTLGMKPDVGSPAAIQQAQQAQPVDPTKWREQFRSVGQMENGPIVEVIKGVLQEGTCFIGANPGDGKTLVALSMAKAICTGQPFLGLFSFSVPQPRQVIYLIPETRDRAFRRRCEAFRIPDDPTKFLARTTSMGPTFPLNDPYLMQAVRETNAVVFLDTASRFMKTNDENSAAQNQALVNDVVALQQAGAVCVVLVHHATKASANETMTLENMLRGTGDFAAMCDQVYGIRKDRATYANGNGPMEIQLANLKDREQIGELTSLRLAASRKSTGSIFPTQSIIDETGNFKVIDKREERNRETEALLALIKTDPTISAKDLAREVGGNERTIKTQLQALGWHRARGGKDGGSPWHEDLNGKCPYETEAITEVKPAKKTFDLTLTDVVKDLAKFLEGTSSQGDYETEANVLLWADQRGISDTTLNKAKKRLGVVVDKNGDIRTWALPEKVQEATPAAR